MIDSLSIQLKQNIDKMKNTAKGFTKIINFGPDFQLIKCHNQSEKTLRFSHPVATSFIQLHFALHESSQLVYHGGHYIMPVKEGQSALLYEPNKNLPIELDLPPNAKFIIILTSIDQFHRFFSEEAELIHFLNPEHLNQKYYFQRPMTPKELVILSELFNFSLRPTLETLFSKGKAYEFLSVYFNKSDNNDACPFLKDEDNVEKIKLAKSIIIERVANPPSLTELASEIGLPLKKLKDGFKQIYGDTVFNFLFEYKMDFARQLIEAQKHNVSEISELVGYTAPSHFITAFKQKFGTTPKQYMLNL